MKLADYSCEYFSQGLCRSCEKLPVDGGFSLDVYSKTVEEKQNQLLDSFDNQVVRDFFPSPLIQGFRNKAKLSFFRAGDSKDSIELGIYPRQGEFLELQGCRAHSENIRDLLPKILRQIRAMDFSIYDHQQKAGELKHLILLEGSDSSIGLKIVTRSPALKSKIKKLAEALSAQIPHLCYVVMNIQGEHSAILEGKEELLIWGKPILDFDFGDFKIEVPAQSFSQVNTEVARGLYHQARSRVQEFRPELFIELFCGAGAFSFAVASIAKRVMGYELVKSSVLSASRLAKKLDLQHVEFHTLDLLTANPLTQIEKGGSTVILVNPPRRGLGLELCRHISDYSPEAILYSSCNLESLKQDLESLKDYSPHFVQGFDMFPWTQHMEILVELRRRS